MSNHWQSTRAFIAVLLLVSFASVQTAIALDFHHHEDGARSPIVVLPAKPAIFLSCSPTGLSLLRHPSRNGVQRATASIAEWALRDFPLFSCSAPYDLHSVTGNDAPRRLGNPGLGEVYLFSIFFASNEEIYMRSYGVLALVFFAWASVHAQSINSGTVTGAVTDPTSAIVRGATVKLRNSLTGYEQSATTDEMGNFRFTNIPLNPYQLTAEAPGFSPVSEQIDVRSSVPITENLALKVAGASTTVTVGAATQLLEEVRPRTSTWIVAN